MTETHNVIQSIVLTPLNENASAVHTYRNREHTLTWGAWDFKITHTYGPTARKQKLLDAGFSSKEADKILDALGEK